MSPLTSAPALLRRWPSELPQPAAATAISSDAMRMGLVMGRSSAAERALRIGARPGPTRGMHRSSPLPLARAQAAGARIAASIAGRVARRPARRAGRGARRGGRRRRRGSIPISRPAVRARGARAPARGRPRARGRGACTPLAGGEPALAGALLVAVAGLALHALPAPPDGAALFTLALVGAGVPAAAAAHAALLHPGGRAAGALDRAAAAAGYVVTVGLLGLLPALVFDPPQSGCFACPDNLLLVHADPGAADWLARWAPRAAAATEAALAALVVVRLLRRPAAARSLAAPVSAAAVAVLALAAVANVRVADGLAGTETDRLLWLATAAALGLLAAGLAWRPLRALRTRAALGRLTIAASGKRAGRPRRAGPRAGRPGVSLLMPASRDPRADHPRRHRGNRPPRRRAARAPPSSAAARSSPGSSTAPGFAPLPSCWRARCGPRA